jgi:HK97 family phage prohead protease
MTKSKTGGPVERLFVGLGEVKITADETAPDDMTFAGYGAVFGNVDSYGDVIAKGAFAETLKKARSSGQWPAMLSQHGGMFGDDSTPIGIYTEMREDDHGLYVEGKLAPTERGREAYELLKMKPRPAYNGLSIGFRAKEWAVRTAPEEPRRTLKAVELLEVSLVTFPANGKARITSVKSELNPRVIEDGLREAGLSRADSVKAVAVFKEILQRDAEELETDPCDEDAAAELRNAELMTLADRIKALAA